MHRGELNEVGGPHPTGGRLVKKTAQRFAGQSPGLPQVGDDVSGELSILGDAPGVGGRRLFNRQLI